MSDDVLQPLVGAGLHAPDKAALDELLASPNAREIVQASSFEQVFFTIKGLGLADAAELLPLVSGKQVRGFIDLDCWRKDAFVRRPFIEWIAAFVQSGPEETVRALGGIDETVIALFLKDLIEVFEVDRDDPPPSEDLVFSPDNRYAVRHLETGDAASVASLILDAVFRYAPQLGYNLLHRVRFTTRAELEETAYQNKVRRLDIHGFVDYYEALSIYAGAEDPVAPPRPGGDEPIPGEEPPGALPTVFADSLAGGRFLLAALGRTPPEHAERLAGELTALGNRILSANLVNLGEVNGIRVSLQEMRDILTIGLEWMSEGDAAAGASILSGNHVQAIFKAGFGRLVRLRTAAERLTRLPGYRVEQLEGQDREFLAGLLRFKPLLWEVDRYRGFRDLTDVGAAEARLSGLHAAVEGLLAVFGPIDFGLRTAFNTAVISRATGGPFAPDPIPPRLLEQFVAGDMKVPDLDLPSSIQPAAAAWLRQLREDLEPLKGKRIDPRFIPSIRFSLEPEREP